jgi:hypothetical protein
MDMEIETVMETETDMETEMKTDNTWTWTWTWPRTRTWTWNWRIFVKYFIRRNGPNSAIWTAFEITRRNFQWRYILVSPLQYEKKSYRCWNSFPNDVLAELEISAQGKTKAATRGMYSNWKLIYHIQNLV